MTIKIYHNPRCSKSRQALQLLKDNGVEPEIKEYLKEGLTAVEIKQLLALCNSNPRDIMRKGETEYKENNLANKNLSDEQLIEAIATYPKLLERPLVVCDNEVAVLGRPPEKILEILG
ncbi:MAG: arsenate reductase (glutaredoxin) [Gammaproteobacteria bacterium]|nr:MAG: arsenate reductase (glutaredoxin) [Gammaproteobacteria bacterium]